MVKEEKTELFQCPECGAHHPPKGKTELQCPKCGKQTLEYKPDDHGYRCRNCGQWFRIDFINLVTKDD